MLKLRRAVVREVVDASASVAEQQLVIELAAERLPLRAAVADVRLVGRAEVGDELVVNVQALDIGLGSGGFDIVHVNLTRGLRGGQAEGGNAMKLNYTSLQHAVEPVEDERLRLPVRRPVAVLALHGQLAAVAWAFSQSAPGRRLGYVQTEGGALPGGHSRTAAELRRRGLLDCHLTAGAAFGGDGEAITTAGALHHGLRSLDWDAAVCGPGPGIVGSSSVLGHGGIYALDSAHGALALGCPTVVVARMSSGDERARHRGLSHHTRTVLELLLAPVTVALPAGEDLAHPARIARHEWRSAPVDLAAFASSGLPAATMGRELFEDTLFFGAALAGGAVLADLTEQAGAGGDAIPRR
jgi:Protein of unknown function (DUF3866)